MTTTPCHICFAAATGEFLVRPMPRAGAERAVRVALCEAHVEEARVFHEVRPAPAKKETTR